MNYEIKVKILRDDNGNVNGISFVPGPESYTEDFVGRFPQALQEGRATIRIDDDKIVLNGPTFNGGRGEFKFEPKPEELEGLRASVFAGSDKKLVPEPADPYNLSGAGFKLTLK